MGLWPGVGYCKEEQIWWFVPALQRGLPLLCTADRSKAADGLQPAAQRESKATLKGGEPMPMGAQQSPAA